jgi:hypothetical protein
MPQTLVKGVLEIGARRHALLSGEARTRATHEIPPNLPQLGAAKMR